ncbi:hypothetical protein LMK08_12385 [Metapseudomonas furukawaii]|uniref:hypothetical protein n=1 Tax=Metapseudomonas furukawaii TaxID=1149133 RepID=UPI00227AB1E0|nr:hypothetical protein [Pseudomonas furukawaii]WAG81416.1 hypothetical protein LMK08_12385 [Pseudomonas furukawaii]
MTRTSTRGIEFEVAGELARNWQVQGGYTHRVTRDGDDDKVSTTEPEDLFRLPPTACRAGSTS